MSINLIPPDYNSEQILLNLSKPFVLFYLFDGETKIFTNAENPLEARKMIYKALLEISCNPIESESDLK